MSALKRVVIATMSKQQIKHESHQDRETIRSYLEQITQGLEEGLIRFSNGDESVVLEPEGLLHLQIIASSNKGKNQLGVKISWSNDTDNGDQVEKLVID